MTGRTQEMRLKFHILPMEFRQTTEGKSSAHPESRPHRSDTEKCFAGKIRLFQCQRREILLWKKEKSPDSEDLVQSWKKIVVYIA